MHPGYIYRAALALGHHEPISIETDGKIWTGTSNDRYDLTDDECAAVHKKAADAFAEDQATKEAALKRIGLTADEIRVIFG
jgi:hypothetical protein